MSDKAYDYLIVGAGLFGATFAYLAKKAGKKVLVIDKNPVIGGHIYTERKDGIDIHKFRVATFLPPPCQNSSTSGRQSVMSVPPLKLYLLPILFLTYCLYKNKYL